MASDMLNTVYESMIFELYIFIVKSHCDDYFQVEPFSQNIEFSLICDEIVEMIGIGLFFQNKQLARHIRQIF